MFDIWIGDIELTTVVLIFSVVVLLTVQLLLCFKVKSKIIRLLPAVLLSIPTLLFAVMAVRATGWDRVGHILFAVFGGFMMLMCGIGWGIWALAKKYGNYADMDVNKEGGMLKQHYKNVVFLFSVHMLAVVTIFLRLTRTVSEPVWLISILFLCLVIVPSYFFVKDRSMQTWGYLLFSVGTHIVFSALIWIVLSNLVKGWDVILIYYTELFLSVALGLTFAIDFALTLKAKISSNRFHKA
ncbi:MAG: hypothetical protein IJB88_07060 [Clostridia bacterium]|nr:hypothetical protein [Clostridia bacterium]